MRARGFGLDTAAFYFHGFAWWDKAPFVDPALNRVNQSAPSFNRYTGDGWSLNSFGAKELLAEVMDAYLDLRKDFDRVSVGLRLGKERQENGNEIDRLFRVANVIDSLDFRRDVLFPNPFGSIDSFAIGQWTAQPTLYFNNLTHWHLSDSWNNCLGESVPARLFSGTWRCDQYPSLEPGSLQWQHEQGGVWHYRGDDHRRRVGSEAELLPRSTRSRRLLHSARVRPMRTTRCPVSRLSTARSGHFRRMTYSGERSTITFGT
jgi:hypothetical protein